MQAMFNIKSVWRRAGEEHSQKCIVINWSSNGIKYCKQARENKQKRKRDQPTRDDCLEKSGITCRNLLSTFESNSRIEFISLILEIIILSPGWFLVSQFL